MSKTYSDYPHFTFSFDAGDFEKLMFKLCETKLVQWQENSTEGQSYCFLDPDGHKIERHLGLLMSRLESQREAPLKDGFGFNLDG